MNVEKLGFASGQAQVQLDTTPAKHRHNLFRRHQNDCTGPGRCTTATGVAALHIRVDSLLEIALTAFPNHSPTAQVLSGAK